MLPRRNNLERNISGAYIELDGAEKHNMRTLESIHSFNSPTDQVEERISEVEDQLNEIK